MVNLIRKIFIKDYQNVNEEKVRIKHGVVSACFGLFINLILFTFKLVIGLLTGLISLISEALNNITDFLSCFVTLFGFKLANKPADRDHPYGHQRIEYICGLIVSFICLIIGIVLIYSSIIKIVNKEEGNYKDDTLFMWTMIILVVSIIFKVLLGFIYKGMGKAINSIALKASMSDSFLDCIATGVVIISSLLQYILFKCNPSLTWIVYIDPVSSIIVAIFVIVNAIQMINEVSKPLIGEPIDEKISENIKNDINNYDGILGTHDMNAYSYGPTKIFISIHCEVDGYKDVFKTHELIDTIEQEINEKYNVNLTIHMDPVDTKNKDLIDIEEMVNTYIKENNLDLSIHDLRVSIKKDTKYLYFDMVIPNNNLNKDEINNKIISLINSKYSIYKIVIHNDTKFVK